MPRWVYVAAAVLCVAAVVSTFTRLFFGADFIDEAFYAAQGYRFVLGQRPILDDFSPQQTAGLLIAPWVQVHLAAVGDTTALLLSLRVAWFVMNAGVAALWLFVLVRLGWGWVSLVAAATSVSVIPWLIPALSYNTIAVLGVSACLALLVHAVSVHADRGWLYSAAGFCLGVACFAYPTVVFLVGAVVPAVWRAARSWRAMIWFVAGGLVVAGCGAVLLVPHAAGLPRMKAMLDELAAFYGWGGARGGYVATLLERVGGQWWLALQRVSVWLAAVAALLQVMRRPVPWPVTAGALLLIPLPSIGALRVGVPPELVSMALAHSAVATAGVFVVPPLLVRRMTDSGRVVIVAFGAAAVLAAVFASTSSVGWGVMAGMGSVPALPLAIALLSRRLELSMRARPLAGASQALLVLASAATLIALTWTNWSATYRDQVPARLTERVKVGPHAGLWTTPLNASESAALWARTRSLTSADTAFAYHGFPAGYLYSPARPAAALLWTADYGSAGHSRATGMILEDLERTPPSVVIKNLGWPSAEVLATYAMSSYDPARDDVERWVGERYEGAAISTKWQVLVPRDD